MGFEPHSVAGSALNPASRLPLRGPAPSWLPSKGACPFRNPLSWVQIQSGLAPNASRLTFHVLFLERAMGFEPTTTCLGSKDSTTELRPLAGSNPTLAQEPSQSGRRTQIQR